MTTGTAEAGSASAKAPDEVADTAVTFVAVRVPVLYNTLVAGIEPPPLSVKFDEAADAAHV